MKKILFFIKVALIGVAWTIAFLCLSRLLMRAIWKFDIFYRKQWQAIAKYWNDDGVIVGFSDYMFFMMLILLVILWIIGWRKLLTIHFTKLMLMPLQYINNYQLRKYENIDTHVVLKNMAVGEKLTVDDVINDRLKKEKPKPVPKVSKDLRENISQKIVQKKDKE